MKAAQGLRGVLVLQHQDDAFDGVGIVVLAHHSFALLVAERGAAEVMHQHRRAVDLGHDDGTDLGQVVDQADAADDETLVAARDAAASGIGVVIVDGVDDIGDAEAVVLELPGIEIELVLGGEAAEVGVVDHARNRLQRRNHDPALDLRQFLQVFAVGLERVAVDFAARTGHRVEPRRRPGRQHRLADAFVQALPHPVVFIAVAEQDGDQRQAKGAGGAHQQQPRRAVDLPLQRHRDQLLHLFGGQAGHLRGDLCGHVAQLGVGLDREGFPGVDAECTQQHGQNDDREALVQTKAYELVNH